MSSIFVISSSVRRCTSQLFRATQTRGFASKLTGQQMHDATLSATENLDSQSKFSPANQGLFSGARTDHSWNDDPSEMKSVWRDLVHEITETGLYQLLPDAMKWMAKSLEYNATTGNKRRYMALIYTYKNLVPPNQLTEENLRLARILGWSVEMWLGGFLLIDDVVDQATYRRNQLCWYKKTDMGASAVLDGFNLLQLPYEILRRHFRELPYYREMMERYQQVTLKTFIGMSSEFLVSRFDDNKKPDFNNYKLDLYNRMTIFKSNVSIALPVHLAMYLAGVKDPELFRQVELILDEIGRFYQWQNDYRDCFGDPGFKTETDIEGGRFTWLIAVALQRATPEQRKIIEECYGQKDPEKVATIKQLYIDLGIPSVYSEVEEQSYNLINGHIQHLSDGIPHDVFYKFRDNIFDGKDFLKKH